MKNKKMALTTAVFLLAHSAGVAAVSEPREASAGDAPIYQVQCKPGSRRASACKLDADTYAGWQTYQTHCKLCHGRGGRGGQTAPNLLDRFNHAGVDYARFKYVITHGFTGEVGGMPEWSGNQQVMGNLDNLYRYLRARADGVLPRGRPKQ